MRITSLALLAISTAFVCSCSTTKYVTDATYTLDRVEMPEQMAKKDNNVYISAEYAKIGINLYIKNISNQSVAIDWERTTICDELGVAHRIITSRTKPEDAGLYQEPTVLEGLSKLTMVIYPRECLKKVHSLGWVYAPIANLVDYESESRAKLYQIDAQPVKVILWVDNRPYTIFFKAADKKVLKIKERK